MHFSLSFSAARAVAAPVAGAYIEVCGYDSDWSAADGSYRLLAMPPGSHLILVRRNGFKELALSVSVSTDIKLDLRMERE